MSTNDNAAGGPPLLPRGTAASGVAAGTRSQAAASASAASGSRTQSTSGSTSASGSTSGVASGSTQSLQAIQSVEEHIPHHGYPSSLKLPTFWITRPELWFIQVESAFRNRHPPVTSDIVKFDCVIGALPSDVMEKVEHVLVSPAQVGGRYAALQNALIESYGRTPVQKQDELIQMTVRRSLGDMKPTDFLMRVRALSGCEYEAVERAILLNALPPEVRTVLANSKAANNKRLALEANQVLEQHLIANARSGAVHEVADSALDDEVNAVSSYRNRGSGPRQDRRQPLPARQHQQVQGRLCQNHARFGDRAYVCRGGDCPRRFEPLMPRPSKAGNGPSGNGRAGR